MHRAALALLAAAALVRAQSLTIDGNKLTVRTPTVEVSFDGPVVTSIRPAGRDIEFVHPAAPPPWRNFRETI